MMAKIERNSVLKKAAPANVLEVLTQSPSFGEAEEMITEPPVIEALTVDPPTVQQGQPQTLLATTTGRKPAEVTFRHGATLLGTVQAADGRAELAVTNRFEPGTYILSAATLHDGAETAAQSANAKVTQIPAAPPARTQTQAPTPTFSDQKLPPRRGPGRPRGPRMEPFSSKIEINLRDEVDGFIDNRGITFVDFLAQGLRLNMKLHEAAEQTGTTVDALLSAIVEDDH